jgi:hypothetical protein
MKCEDCLSLIEEYFDAELNQQESAKVAKHLTACETCNEVYLSLDQEQQLYAHYQRDIEVTPALWQAVRKSIKQEASARQETPQSVGVMESLRRFFTETFHAPRFSPALAAMLVVVAVGVTVLVMNYVNSPTDKTQIAVDNNKNSNETTPATNGNQNKAPQSSDGVVANDGSNNNTTPHKEVTPTPVPQPEENIGQPKAVKAPKPYAENLQQAVHDKVTKMPPNTTAEALLRDAEQKYIKAIAILQRDFDKRRSKLDPQLVAKLETSLASIDRTIAETRKAVQQNAGDPIAVQYMLTAYAKKVEVLRDVTAD